MSFRSFAALSAELVCFLLLDVDAGIASPRARDERIPGSANLPFSELFN